MRRCTRAVLWLGVVIAFALATVFSVVPVSATAGTQTFWFAGKLLIFESSEAMQGDVAVSSGDRTLDAFLLATGATLAYQPGQKYVVITAADRRTIAFTIGDARYTAGGVTEEAPFAPYVSGANAYVPFLALAKALYVDAVADGSTTVMQPQLGSLDVSTRDRTTTVTLQGATHLRYERTSAAGDERVSMVFLGTASTLQAQRQFPAGGALRTITIASMGNQRNPRTIVTFDVVPGTVHALAPSDSSNAISISFAPGDVKLPGQPIPASGVTGPPSLTDIEAPDASQPSPESPPSSLPGLPSASAAQVGAVTTSADSASGGVRIDIAVSGNAAFAWHRLPDNRWYIDLTPASLTGPPHDLSLSYDSVTALRVKGFAGSADGVPTVRVALSLDAVRDLSVERTGNGIAIHVGGVTQAAVDRSGSGEIGDAVLAASPVPVPAPASSPSPLPGAQITGFTTSLSGDGSIGVNLAMTGQAYYEWHRVSDHRWYVDFKPATLTIPSQDVPLRYDAMPSMRIKAFVGPRDAMPTVRIALSLDSARSVSLVQTPGGPALEVGSVDPSSAQTVGYGRFLDGSIVASATDDVPGTSSASAPPAAASDVRPSENFSGRNSGKSRVIVIDPGHGGSDSGAEHNGLTEKFVTLDIADRLRDLLVSRGWMVKMTRTTDVDVYGPNASARDELQARCDVANSIGARLFVSIHVNSFTTSEQHGTTTYYYNAESLGLARAVHARLAATLPTADDGVIKENFYVIHHTSMPSILVETAFLSNPVDAKYLRSPSFLQSIASGIADGVGDYVAGPSE